MEQHRTPIYQALMLFNETNPVSFHVPGHKNGSVFPGYAGKYFDSILKLDMTELPGLDDLHAPEGIIAEAERLAAGFFKSDHTYFLVGGSTAGNLAMILAACSAGDGVIVQRNCHKSIMNGMELSGANPIFIAPEYDAPAGRFTNPSMETLREALKQYPGVKAVVLTYPDYFGKTYEIKEMIELAHEYHIPVLVDEAHGTHFSIGDPFPSSALAFDADAVVQSAHKMAPAMTMASFLHMNSEFVSKEKVAHYLQMIQSSSPSYPLMASLDLARSFLATLKQDEIKVILQSVSDVKRILQESEHWELLTVGDPLKLTLHIKNGITAQTVARLFEEQNIYPELTTHNQILFIHGLAPLKKLNQLKKAVKRVNEQLKNMANHDTIEIAKLFQQPIQELALSYAEMEKSGNKQIQLNKACGYIAAEAVIPYPPGIPLILKGEKITADHIETIESLRRQGVRIQHRDIDKGLNVFTV